MKTGAGKKNSSPTVRKGGVKDKKGAVVVKKSAPDAKKFWVDKATIIRRVSKLLKSSGNVPDKCCWKAENLPTELLDQARKLYIHHKTHVGRADQDLAKDSIYKRCKASLLVRYKQGKLVKDASRVDSAAMLFIPFVWQMRKTKKTEGSQWDTQTSAMRSKTRKSNSDACRNGLRKLHTDVELTGDLEQGLEDVVLQLLAAISEEFSTLEAFQTWYTNQQYSFRCLAEDFWYKVKDAQGNCDAMKKLMDDHKIKEAPKADASGMDHFWFAMNKKIEKAYKALLLERRALMLLVKLNLVKETYVAGAGWTYYLNTENVESRIAESPGKARPSTNSPLKSHKEYSLTVAQIETSINNESTTASCIAALFKVLKMEPESILTAAEKDLAWMGKLGKLDCSDLMKNAGLALEKASSEFLPPYYLLKTKSDAVTSVVGEFFTRRAGKAAYEGFLHDVKGGDLMKWESTIQQMVSEGQDVFYCGKILLLVDALTEVLRYETYEEMVNAKDSIHAVAKNLKNGEPEVREAFRGYMSEKLTKMHREAWDELAVMVNTKDIRESWEKFCECQVLENVLESVLDLTGVWKDFLLTEEGKQLAKYDEDMANSDLSSGGFSDANEEDDGSEAEDEMEDAAEDSEEQAPASLQEHEDSDDLRHSDSEGSAPAASNKMKMKTVMKMASKMMKMAAATVGSAMKKSSPKASSASAAAASSSMKKSSPKASPSTGASMKTAVGFNKVSTPKNAPTAGGLASAKNTPAQAMKKETLLPPEGEDEDVDMEDPFATDLEDLLAGDKDAPEDSEMVVDAAAAGGGKMKMKTPMQRKMKTPMQRKMKTPMARKVKSSGSKAAAKGVKKNGSKDAAAAGAASDSEE
eukprot:g10611.t1